MRVEYINPFVESSCDILKEVLGTDEVIKDELFLKETTVPILGVAVVIGLTGSVKGRVLLDMNLETALQITSVMNGETVNEFGDLAKATITELANMIGGRSITGLHNEGFNFEMSPPSIFTGANMEITSHQLEAFIVPLETPYGKVEVNVALKEKS